MTDRSSTDSQSASVVNPLPAADVTHPGGMGARRVFPTDRQNHLDPFVLFERFFIDSGQGFDTHPHRGFEIVSYMLSGGMAHADSMGEEHVVRPGDTMAITTGGGMTHSELPDDDEPCSGLQLWVNLPREKKDVRPRYQGATGEELPVNETEGATVTTVVGEESPLSLHTELRYRDVRVSESWTWDVPDEWAGFAFVVSGEGTVRGESADGEPIGETEYVVVEDGGSVVFEGEGLRVAVVDGVPHREPIVQHGPYVE
jgi:redox-sensitive bicupin YhaK (pirin superfamily)